MFDMGFNIYAFVTPQSTHDYAGLLMEAEAMAIDDEISFEDVYFAEEVLETYAEKYGDCEEAERLLKKPPVLYAYDAIAMTAGEWCSRLGLGYQEFYERIVERGSVEAAIRDFVEESQFDDHDQ